MSTPESLDTAPVDISLLPRFAWNLRWRDPCASLALCQRLADRQVELPPEGYAGALCGLAWHLRRTGDFSGALSAAEEATQIYSGLDESTGWQWALLIQASTQIDRADLPKSHECLTRSLLRGKPGDSPVTLIEFHALRARLYWYAGEARRADEHMAIAVRDARDELRAVALHDSAWIALLKKDRVALRAQVSEAKAIAEALQVEALMPTLLMLAAALACTEGDLDRADAHLDAAERRARAGGNVRATSLIRHRRGVCRRRQGDLDAAIAETRAASDLALAIGYRLLAPIFLAQLGELLTEVGAYADADATFRRAMILNA